ncbi:hypothetical protein [Streptomyces showdoensis]|uniref:Uncharacterized protein n=1 Tax=Streptomyces showdoensis TaxID=68268 RepID=A0A2P2GKR1_STREW|nr:hypothetical protein [Streptomyces showdoensis]KKZ72104.1 hypothetical protein VO63_20220 [Streptomyces showdoensis]
MATVTLIEPNGYTVTTHRDVPTDQVDTITTHLIETVAPEHASQWADFGYNARDYTVRVR